MCQGMDETLSIRKIKPSTVRYIKLGEGGRWFEDCIAQGLLRFAEPIPHDLATKGDWDAVRALYIAQGSAKPGNALGELRTFYEQGPECLWITIGGGRLWWAFAERDVQDAGNGERIRRTLNGWSSQDVRGAPLMLTGLSSRLTKTAGYPRTICGLEPEVEAYLLRRLNCDQDPLLSRAEAARTELLDIAETELHWRDFEVLVDLIFAGSGWRRIGAVGGGAQADSDLILQQAATGERALVQVKSSADEGVLEDYLRRFRAQRDMDRLFFVCHSFRGSTPPQMTGVHVWLRSEVAQKAIQAGFLDWLLERRL